MQYSQNSKNTTRGDDSMLSPLHSQYYKYDNCMQPKLQFLFHTKKNYNEISKYSAGEDPKN